MVASPGDRIIDISRKVGVRLKSECGGKGKCGKCLIKFEANSVHPGGLSTPQSEEEALLPEDQEGFFYRLACVTRVYKDVKVIVPPESLVYDFSPRKPFRKFKIPIDPAVSKFVFSVSHKDRVSPSEPLMNRFQAALSKGKEQGFITVPLTVMAEFFSQEEATSAEEITATLFKGKEVIQLQPGTKSDLYGIAIDLGTTTLAAFLCDLTRDRIVASASALNPQVTYGEDVISRIALVQKDPSQLGKMRGVLIEAVNGLIREMAQKAEISKDDLLDAIAVGNPTMQHVFLGLNPTTLGQAPYLPVCNEGGEAEARDLDLSIFPHARVHLMPMLSGFIGSDTLAALLTLDRETFERTTLFVDVGTNGELVLAKKGMLTATSCATGPVFEGAQIKCGMRATSGAIEKVWADKNSGTIRYQVIGDHETSDAQKPSGICGSGVISAISSLLLAGIIKKDGAFNLESEHPGLRINQQSGMADMVIVPEAHSQTGLDIVITQDDIRAVQLGKAALRAGIEILQKDLNVARIDQILLAGTFGNYLNPRDLLNIGMLPPMEVERIESIGNAAGDGARLALFSLKKRQEAIELANRIQVVELSMRSDFQEVFVDSMSF